MQPHKQQLERSKQLSHQQPNQLPKQQPQQKPKKQYEQQPMQQTYCTFKTCFALFSFEKAEMGDDDDDKGKIDRQQVIAKGTSLKIGYLILLYLAPYPQVCICRGQIFLKTY